MVVKTNRWQSNELQKIFVFLKYFQLNLQHINEIGSQKVDNIALNFFYLLFLYRCDPAGALFLRNLGPWSLGSIKWVIFLCFCLNPELGSKWRWWGMPSNFLIPHTIVLSFELNEVGVNHSMFKCRAHSFIHCSQNVAFQHFVSSQIVSCLLLNIVSQYVVSISVQSIPGDPWVLTCL